MLKLFDTFNEGESEAVMKLTLTIPTTIIGPLSPSRKDLCNIYGLHDPVWDDDRESKLDDIMKKWNPNNVDSVIPRYTFGSFMKAQLEKYYTGLDFVFEFELPKIKIITINAENVEKLYNSKKSREIFNDKIGGDDESRSMLTAIVYDHIKSGNNRPLRFEVILKDTGIVVNTVETSDGIIPVHMLER
jgi:hypothetical protein